MTRKSWLILPALLILWIGADMAIPQTSSLTRFDGHDVGRLETAMWRSYYEHQPVRLYLQLVQVLRSQYGLPFWPACVGAYHAARAAVVFQRGHNRTEYELALPNLVSYYAIIRRSSDIAFAVEQTAQLELEWWIIHRERDRQPPGELERSLAVLQAAIYHRPESLFQEHAKARADAMLLRDAAAEHGGVSEQEWRRIGDLLDTSWVSLQAAVTR